MSNDQPPMADDDEARTDGTLPSYPTQAGHPQMVSAVPRPPAIATAVKLMYAGAVLSLIGLIVTLLSLSSLKVETASRDRQVESGLHHAGPRQPLPGHRRRRRFLRARRHGTVAVDGLEERPGTRVGPRRSHRAGRPQPAQQHPHDRGRCLADHLRDPDGDQPDPCDRDPFSALAKGFQCLLRGILEPPGDSAECCQFVRGYLTDD